MHYECFRTSAVELQPFSEGAPWVTTESALKPGSVVLAVAVTDREFLAEVERAGARIVTRAPKDGAEIIFYGAERREALDRVARLSQGMKPNGALWVIRPKGQRRITEADVMSAGKHAGLVDVKVVSFSDTHTAEKFVIPVTKRAAHESNSAIKESARPVRGQ